MKKMRPSELKSKSNCQSRPIRVFIFGDCFKEHWKVQISTAVLSKPSQLLTLGICPDFGFCKGRRKDGENCRNFVNTSLSDRCAFHIEACANKFAARRGVFNSLNSLPPKKFKKQGFLSTLSNGTTISTYCERPEPGPSNTDDSSKRGLFKKTKFTEEDLKVLLKKKSSHEAELEKEMYFNKMEKKEKIETFVTSLMEVKGCNVITCKKCNYTAQKQSNYCKINGHLIIRHKADKRFYKCCSCSRRVICYELMPTKPCPGCGEKDYERVAMKQERKVKGLNEELLVRGEERKFVNV
ncbi:unnamed protein product [Enterobius vermicularis]|uniref:Protein MCM10 homolog n=1 Tax=Enterobius vermicularis TaxID=51028 RepID=A0A0N4VKH1_ENTVE|nr:unnamed protein product [Enterobius vermicularis]